MALVVQALICGITGQRLSDISLGRLVGNTLTFGQCVVKCVSELVWEKHFENVCIGRQSLYSTVYSAVHYLLYIPFCLLLLVLNFLLTIITSQVDIL